MKGERMSMADNILEIDAVDPTTSAYLTASELVSFRKNNDEHLQCIVGQKLYKNDKTWLEEKAVECALQNHKEVLNQKRASRICDLMKAEWNKDLNAAVTSKLKGKFIQHMGVIINGKIILSPEESMFLIENKSIEVMQSNMPLSTEEAYAVMFKKNMIVEKYQVYSHLSQLGFIVVHHQPRLDIAQYESILNADKHHSRNKRKSSSPLPQPKEKRLTFSGALLSDPELNMSTHSVNDDSTTSSDCQLLKENGQTIRGKHQVSENELNEKDSVKRDQNTEVQSLEVTAEGSAVITNIPDSTVDNSDAEFVGSVDSISENINVESTKVLPSASIDDTNDVRVEEVDSNISYNSEESLHDSQNEIGNEDSICCESQSLGESIVDVDSIETPEGESNQEKSDVISCSSENDESDVEDLDNNSSNVTIVKEHAVDEDITLLEVKKKETKPLAVIDLLSDEEQDGTMDEGNEDSDDEIQIVKVCTGPSSRTQKSRSRKLDVAKFKREMHDSQRPIQKRSCDAMMKFPDFFKKGIVCVQRPPVNYLPNRVQPRKELYVLNLEKQNSQQSQPRLWNSFRDLQEYQRGRHRRNHSDSPVDRFHRYDNRQSFGQNFWQNPGPSRNRMHHYNNPDSSDMHAGANNSNHNFPSRYENHPQDAIRDTQQSEYPFYRDDMVSVIEHGRNLSLPRVDAQGIEPMLTDPALPMNLPPLLRNLPPLRSAQIMAELQRTALSVASSMLSSMFNTPIINPNLQELCNSSVNVSISNGPNLLSMHNGFSNFVPRNNENQANLRSDMMPNSLPPQHLPDSVYSRQRYEEQNYPPYIPNNGRNRDFRRRHPPHRGAPFPCHYRNAPNKRSWNDVKAAVGSKDVEDECDDNNSDIEEVPINVNQVLWSNEVHPLIRPGAKQRIPDVLKSLRITQMANLLDPRQKNEKYLPNTTSLEVSYDVYLPGTNYKRSCPGTPKYRVVVVRAADPIPKYSELLFLQRKWNDGAILQIAVVDNGDISFYSFNSIELPEMLPVES